MNQERLHILFDKHLEGSLTNSEREELAQLVKTTSKEELENILVTQLQRQTNALSSLSLPEAEAKVSLLLSVDKKVPQSPVYRIHFMKTTWLRSIAAAILILIIGSVVYFWNTQKEKPIIAKTSSVPAQNDLAPGGNKAVLTLADGKKIVLNDSGNGTLAKQNGVTILKANNDEVHYETSNISSTLPTAFNTMSTPKGGQYELILADRTHVWLNAASSITYPTAFNGKTREVSVTGECYFEVSKDAKKPFIVRTLKEDIQVLGTHFNVNAYADESAMKTSLLEGSVKIGKTILKPGQAYLNGQVALTDIQQDVAWKNGVFNFNHISLDEAMRQLSRWYDIEVEYKDDIPAFNFYGEMQRTLTLSQVLNGLADLGVTFTIERGKRLIVSKDKKTRLTK